MFLRRLVGRVLFLDMGYLVKKARTDIIHEEDMPKLPDRLDPQQGTTLSKWKTGIRPWRFLFSVIPTYWERLRWGYSFFGLAMVSSLVSPVLINHFIRALDGGDWDKSLAVGVMLALCGVVMGVCFQHYFHKTLAANQLTTNDLNQLIFRQSLVLSLRARTKSQVGDIVNHMTSDTDALADFPIILGDLTWAVVTIIGAVSMLFYYIGWSALPAMLVLSALIPLTHFVAKRFVRYEEKMMAEKDARITLMSQVLNSIRVIKFFSWEKAMSKEVAALRQAELKSRKTLARAEVLSGITYLAVSTVVLFIALLTHAYRGQTLDAATVFTCISLFGLLEEPFGQLSRLFSRFSQGLVSSKRIMDFLEQEKVQDIVSPLAGHSVVAVEMKNASLSYAETPVISGLNFQVQKGQSLAIVGPVGAGKSTLLYGILSECRLVAGEIHVDQELSRVAYVPQEAYIINSSLLENINFGAPEFSKEKLRRSIHQACLDKDLKDLPSGLRTEIGEKGVNLSGGQKQRVSLARAAYANPQLVLLDDPLSAVDVETEKLICDRLLFGEWAGLTRIVVTHRLESLERFDQVLFLKEGEVQAIGTLPELLAQNIEFKKFYSQHDKTQAGAASISATIEEPAAEDAKSASRITDDEEREKGAVKASVYGSYILSLGGEGRARNWILFLLAFLALAGASMPLLQKGWISNFQKFSPWNGLDITPMTAVWIYGILGAGVLLFNMSNQMFWLERGIIAGKNFHDRMLESILRAPVRFYDSTPVGRVLQRFSRDLESVDIYLQWSFESFIHCLLHVLVALVLIVTVLPVMLFVIVPSLWIYNRLQQDYRRPAREAKRLDSIARSPRYAHFKETLMGLVVIRAFKKEDWFLQDFFRKLQHSQRMFYGHYMLNRWFSAQVPVVAGFISVSTLVGISYGVKNGWLTPGVAGLVTTYAITFWGTLNWGIRIFADIESRMTSVERLKFYSNITSEKLLGAYTPAPSWPQAGFLKVEGLKVQYAPHLPLVLKGLNFEIQAGEKIGIIGRTGSGKSTLFQDLYRFIEPTEGKILLDGVNVADVDLEKLRRSLAIVPQDPSLFMGTLRSNLDRYHEFTDEEVWAALEKAGMKEFVQGIPLQLSAPVAENGGNLSQGQRQLLCLARALLMDAKIVLMDEATASVDVQTDAQIQRVIRENMKGVTMLIIAHRLGTVSDCDQIIELSEGTVKSIYRSAELEKVASRDAGLSELLK